ncbi:MAG TPA: dTDP-4-dehydrorhamnose reductase [Dehalococcoidia bacterium]|nr:dTDP-4-dehydrorhamnose reductase [Dehalococcoidia bacterium]
MRVLITGGGGQLARELLRALAEHEVVAPTRRELDVTNEARVRQAVSGVHPDLVIHTAALTDTTRCEREPLRAQQVNAIGTLNVVSAACEVGARFVYISTNEVFDGTKRTPYEESDSPNPINAYGYSKLCGERAVTERCARFYVVRTAWLYGDGDRHFPAKLLRAAAASEDLRVVDDEVATPTWCRDLARAVVRLVLTEAPSGVYHLTNAGEASRFAWASRLFELTGARVRLTPVSSREYHDGSDGPRKPAYSVLANTAAARAGIVLRDWREAFDEFAASWTRHG